MKRILRLVLCLLATWFAAVMLLSLAYRVIPPVTPLMVAHWLGGGVDRQWVPLENISPNLVRAVLVSEDARFCDHHGIDWKAVDKVVREAQRKGDNPRGASTITMQVAKNLFLWNGRSWLRKSLEAPIALWLDFAWPKSRILEVYLNIAEWGDGRFGIEAAARHEFGVHASQLSPYQSALLTVMLPDPAGRSAARPGPATLGMAATVQARAGGANRACLTR